MQSSKKHIERLVDKQATGSFLGIDDIVEVLQALSRDYGEVLFIACADNKILTNLSCHVDNAGQTSIFSNQSELDRVKKFAVECGLTEHKLNQSSLFLRPDRLSPDELSQVERLLKFIFRNTIHNENLIADRIAVSERAAIQLANKLSAETKEDRVNSFLIALAEIDEDFSNADIVFGGVRLRKFRSHFQRYDSAILLEYQPRLGVLGCINSGNSAILKSGDQNFFLVPMKSSVRDSIFENAVLVVPLGDSLLSEKIKRLENTANAFQRQYKSAFRTSVVSKLERVLNAGFQITLEQFDWEYVNQYLVDALGSIAADFLFATNAHSFVFRAYEAHSRSLTPKYDLHVGEAGKRNTAEIKIKLSDEETSCNAFTFMHCAPSEGAIYLPDVTAIPNDLQRRGLRSISHWRQSRSEITAPIFFKETPIGTLNIESEFPNNFDKEFDLVVQIVRIVSRYLEALIERYDSRWIGEVAQSRAAIHEARQITLAELESPDIKPLRAENQSAVLELHSLIEASLQYRGVKASETLAEVIAVELARTPKHLKQNRREPWINIPDVEALDMQMNAHIAYILREQIRNYYRSSDRHSRLRILFHPAQRVGSIKGFLYIETLLAKRLGKSLQSKFALLPLTFDGRLHYGMYLAGILTRAAGGWVHVQETEPTTEPLVAVTIRLPVMEH